MVCRMSSRKRYFNWYFRNFIPNYHISRGKCWFIWIRSGGYFYDAGSGGAYAAAYQVDDYVGCILDLDNGTIEFTVNGVSQGVAKTGLPAGSYRFSSRGGRHDGAETLDRWNFGQNPLSSHHRMVSNQ